VPPQKPFNDHPLQRETGLGDFRREQNCTLLKGEEIASRREQALPRFAAV
jgi:hypothetical protein